MYNIPYNDIEANLFFDEYLQKGLLNKIQYYRKYFIKTINKKEYLITEKENTFVKDFLDKYSTERKLRKLITGRPEELLEIVKEVQGQCTATTNHFYYFDYEKCDKISTSNKKTIKVANKIKRKNKTTEDKKIIAKRDKILKDKGIPDFRRILNHIFVENIYEKTDFFDKSNFIEKKGLRTCPYCGRSYIFSIARKGSGVDVKPQIDHFIPKGEFPFLAFSYYNLIPSCDSCNTVCKKEQKPLSEYNDSYLISNPYAYIDSPIFQFKLKNTDVFTDFLLTSEQNVQIDFNPSLKNIVEEYEKLFGLKSLYEKHNDLAHELLIRKQFWASETNQQYYRNILNHDPNIKGKMILAFLGHHENSSEHSKRPFSKFLLDISNHYDDLVKKGNKR